MYISQVWCFLFYPNMILSGMIPPSMLFSTASSLANNFQQCERGALSAHEYKERGLFRYSLVKGFKSKFNSAPNTVAKKNFLEGISVRPCVAVVAGRCNGRPYLSTPSYNNRPPKCLPMLLQLPHPALRAYFPSLTQVTPATRSGPVSVVLKNIKLVKHAKAVFFYVGWNKLLT